MICSGVSTSPTRALSSFFTDAFVGSRLERMVARIELEAEGEMDGNRAIVQLGVVEQEQLILSRDSSGNVSGL